MSNVDLNRTNIAKVSYDGKGVVLPGRHFWHLAAVFHGKEAPTPLDLLPPDGGEVYVPEGLLERYLRVYFGEEKPLSARGAVERTEETAPPPPDNTRMELRPAWMNAGLVPITVPAGAKRKKNENVHQAANGEGQARQGD